MRQASINTDTYGYKKRNLSYVKLRKIKQRATAGLPLVMAAVVLQATGCGSWVDDRLCGSAGCQWSDEEWGRVSALAGLPDTAPADASNKYVGDAAAEAVGKKWFFDTRFAGTATLVDQLKRPVPYARAAKGSTMAVACVTCHDLGNGR